MSKTCSTCGDAKPQDQFKKGPGYADGFSGQCKECINTRRRTHGRVETSEQQRRWNLRGLYGIEPEDYEEILLSQGGSCAICDRLPEDSVKGILHVDHDHATNEIRGLLCSQCNVALGALNDNPDLLQEAAAYLVAGV